MSALAHDFPPYRSRTIQTWRGSTLISTTYVAGLRQWETMVFGGSLDQYQERYDTFFDAERGHDRVVAVIDQIAEGTRIKPRVDPHPVVPARGRLITLEDE